MVGAWMSLSFFPPAAEPNAAVRHVVCILLAPVFFLVPGMRSWAGETGAVPGYVSVFAIVAIIALPSPPSVDGVPNDHRLCGVAVL